MKQYSKGYYTCDTRHDGSLHFRRTGDLDENPVCISSVNRVPSPTEAGDYLNGELDEA